MGVFNLAMEKYKYKDGFFTYAQLEAICKLHYNQKGRWKEKLALLTKWPEKDFVMRKCLKCDKEFCAAGKFERICPNCKNTEQWKENEWTLL